MSSCQIHKLAYSIAIAFIMINVNCSKEPVLKKDGFPDKGDIFVCAFITNSTDNGLSIFGKILPELGISAYIDTGTGFKHLTLSYDQELYRYTAILQNFSFRPGKTYYFKIISTTLQDSIELEKKLPEAFTVPSSINYPTVEEYKYQFAVQGSISDKTQYAHDISISQSSDSNGGSFTSVGNVYTAQEIPWIKKFGSNSVAFQDFAITNNLDIYSGIRLPISGDKCSYLPNNLVKQIRVAVTRFSAIDYEYINSMYDNVDNYGNPFFLSYQPKHIIKSANNKIFGKAVSAFISQSDITRIKDLSSTVLKVYIKDKSGNNVLGNPNFHCSPDPNNEPTINPRNDGLPYLIYTTNMLKYDFTCTCCPPSEDRIPIKYRVTDMTNGKKYTTNTIVTKLSEFPTEVTLTVQ